MGPLYGEQPTEAPKEVKKHGGLPPPPGSSSSMQYPSQNPKNIQEAED